MSRTITSRLLDCLKGGPDYSRGVIPITTQEALPIPLVIITRGSDLPRLQEVGVDRRLFVTGDVPGEGPTTGPILRVGKTVLVCRRPELLFHLVEDPAICPFRYRSEEHTSTLPSLMRIPYSVFCLQK